MGFCYSGGTEFTGGFLTKTRVEQTVKSVPTSNKKFFLALFCVFSTSLHMDQKMISQTDQAAENSGGMGEKGVFKKKRKRSPGVHNSEAQMCEKKGD